MATHNFSFAGGDILTGMGAAWFVSYAYCEKIDRTHKNWNRVSTANARISKYHQGKSFHKLWLQEVLSMNPLRLEKNTIGLSSNQVKAMARELLSAWKDEVLEPVPAAKRTVTASFKNAVEAPPAIEAKENSEERIRKRWIMACKTQFIVPDFLEKYKQELLSLRKNPGFIHEMTEARGEVLPEVEFSCDNEDPAFRRFKNQIDAYLYEAKVYYDYPEFQMIVDDVQQLGIKFTGKAYTKKSANISVYYALRCLKLSEK